MLARRGALANAVSAIEPLVAPLNVDAVLAVDARGFVLGAALCDRLGSGLVMVRKPGKLPGEVLSFDYTCEYCTGRLEVTAGLVYTGLRCLIVDDLLATGGTARATADFTVSQGAIVVGYAFMLEIEALKGRDRLNDAPVVSVVRC
jgi:adenine phosphoribosyltransferase